MWHENQLISHVKESTLEELTLSELNLKYFKESSSDDNAILHVQMWAVADFYDILSLQEVVWWKFRFAFDNIYDIQSIIKIFKLFCNSNFLIDVVLCDIMMSKITTNNNLLNELNVEEILNKNEQLALTIVRCMCLK